jgi:hypothetical protein
MHPDSLKPVASVNRLRSSGFTPALNLDPWRLALNDWYLVDFSTGLKIKHPLVFSRLTNKRDDLYYFCNLADDNSLKNGVIDDEAE